MPSMALDPIPIAARFVTDVQTVISREKDPNAFGVLTIGAINCRQRAQHHPRQR